MNMTHYMSLLADNQPWNLILFMAIPVIFAETITVTEFIILFTKNLNGPLRAFNRACSILAGLYFTGVFLYLFPTAFVPLTVNGEWHTWVDVVAVGFYLSGVFFLLPLALLDLGLIGRNRTEESKLKLHFILISGFLVVAHIAMIFNRHKQGKSRINIKSIFATHGHISPKSKNYNKPLERDYVIFA